MDELPVDAIPIGTGITNEEKPASNARTEQEASDPADSASVKTTPQPLAFY